MNFFDIMFGKKYGAIPFSKNYFDTLFAAKLAEMQIKTLTGTLPLTFTTSETALRSWTIYGNNTVHNYSAQGTLPLTFTTHTAGNAVDWVIYGNAQGVGEQRVDGYYVPLTVSQTGQTDKTVDIYIGDSPLLSRDFIDYKSGKIYKAKRIHEDTVTIDGIVWDILDYDHDEVYKADGTRAKHSVTIQTHDIIADLQYFAKQAAFAFPEGLAAGTYKFTVGAHPWVAGDVNKVLTFTLANAITAGGQLVFNGTYDQTLVGTTISVFASPTVTTAAETVTMTEGDTGTDLGTILRSKTDAINSIDRALRGSNNWLESPMRQYLNSDKAAGSVWSPQTVFDRPPAWAESTAGFLHGIDPDFVAVLGNVKKTTGLNNISDGGGTAVHDEKFFLLSRSEVYMGDEYTGGEDTPYAYYKNYSDNQSPSTSADKNRIKYRAGVAKNWWLRSPNASNAYHVRLVGASGAWYSGVATVAYGVAPACCIILDDMDDWVKQTFYTEVDADLPAIELFSGDNIIDTSLYNKPSMSIEGVDYVGVGEPVNDSWQIPLTVTCNRNLFDIYGNMGASGGIHVIDYNVETSSITGEMSADSFYILGFVNAIIKGDETFVIAFDKTTADTAELRLVKGEGSAQEIIETFDISAIKSYRVVFECEESFGNVYPRLVATEAATQTFEHIMIKKASDKGGFVPYGAKYEYNVLIDAPLTEGQSVSDTQTISTFEGENTIDTSLTNKPQMSITYKGG